MNRLISQVANELWVCEKQKVRRWEGDIQSYKDTQRARVLKGKYNIELQDDLFLPPSLSIAPPPYSLPLASLSLSPPCHLGYTTFPNVWRERSHASKSRRSLVVRTRIIRSVLPLVAEPLQKVIADIDGSTTDVAVIWADRNTSPGKLDVKDTDKARITSGSNRLQNASVGVRSMLVIVRARRDCPRGCEDLLLPMTSTVD